MPERIRYGNDQKVVRNDVSRGSFMSKSQVKQFVVNMVLVWRQYGFFVINSGNYYGQRIDNWQYQNRYCDHVSSLKMIENIIFLCDKNINKRNPCEG